MSTFAFVLFCLKKKKKIHQGNFERWRLGWLYAIRPINFLYSNLKKHKQSLAQFCRLFKLHTQPTTANGYFSSLFFPPPLLPFLLHRFRRWVLFSLFLSSSRCLFSFFFIGASIQSPFFFSWVSWKLKLSLSAFWNPERNNKKEGSFYLIQCSVLKK